jgi:hypothetical protein
MEGSEHAREHFEVRVTAVDWTMAKPLKLFDRTHSAILASAGGQPLPLSAVPVVRVFGATPAGQRCCVHVHQAFPYCYVPYVDEWPDPSKAGDAAAVRRQLHTIAAELDELLGTHTVQQQQQQQQQQQHEDAQTPGVGRKSRPGRYTSVVDVQIIRAMPYCTPLQLCHYCTLSSTEN